MDKEDVKNDQTLDSYLRDPWACYEDDDSACHSDFDDNEPDDCCCCCGC